jgi:predicted aspartyl protease
MAFTWQYDGHPDLLRTEAQVGVFFVPPEDPPDSLERVKAIWDTGASRSAITRGLAERLALKPTGATKLSTAAGQCDSSTYLVSLMLQSRLYIPSLTVTEASLMGFGMLIGMDVIRTGDFAVTNYGGKTTLSFRIPSIERIDFAAAIRATQKVSRNAPCPCGSGKKYKHCCGA